MKRLLMTVVLSCLLSVTAFGGEIPSVPGPQPTPQGTSATSPSEIPMFPGEIPGAELSDAALSALLMMLGLASA